VDEWSDVQLTLFCVWGGGIFAPPIAFYKNALIFL